MASLTINTVPNQEGPDEFFKWFGSEKYYKTFKDELYHYNEDIVDTLVAGGDVVEDMVWSFTNKIAYNVHPEGFAIGGQDKSFLPNLNSEMTSGHNLDDLSIVNIDNEGKIIYTPDFYGAFMYEANVYNGSINATQEVWVFSDIPIFSIKLKKGFNLIGIPLDDSNTDLEGYVKSTTPENLVNKIVNDGEVNISDVKEIQRYNNTDNLLETYVTGFGGTFSEINGSEAYFVYMSDNIPINGIDLNIQGLVWDIDSIDLDVGENWVNLPKDDYTTPQELLTDVSGSDIQRWNIDSQEWQSYPDGFGGPFDLLEGGTGYVINMSVSGKSLNFENGNRWGKGE